MGTNVTDTTMGTTIAEELANGQGEVVYGNLFPEPTRDPAKLRLAAADTELPKSIDELPVQFSRAYDLSITAAADSNIPVVGTVKGDTSRRVVVLERTAYKEIRVERNRVFYGYAIRLAMTVSNLKADSKLTLPFLAASAELGQIEAKWSLSVLGLTGPKMDAVIAPTDLNVETFVLAKQSLAELIDAIRDPSTQFRVQEVGKVTYVEGADNKALEAVGTTYALGCIDSGKSLRKALDELGPSADATRQAVIDTYQTIVGTSGDTADPATSARGRANGLLGRVRVVRR